MRCLLSKHLEQLWSELSDSSVETGGGLARDTSWPVWGKNGGELGGRVRQ